MNPLEITLTVKLSLIGCVPFLTRAFVSCGETLYVTITAREEKRSTTISIFDRFENAIERGVSSAFSRAFRSGIKLVDVSSVTRHPMNDSTKELSPEHTVAANHFVVYAAHSDFVPLGADLEIPADEFALQATEHVTANGYTLLGPVYIDFTVDSTEQAGQPRIGSPSRRDPIAPATASSSSPAHPIIDIDGEKWLLTGPVTVIGRGTEADVVVNDSGVSRHHLELRITPTDVTATDLGSTNGIFVEGHKIDAATLFNGDRIVIGRTPIDFRTHPDSDGDQ